MKTLIAACLLSLAFSTPSLAQRARPAPPIAIRVPADAPAIQSAIEWASDGDTVLVAPGVYHERIQFRGKAITVQSDRGPAVTTIDGTGFFGPVVSFREGEGRGSVLRGFTVTGGSHYGGPPGGGISCYDFGPAGRGSPTSPTIQECVIRGNRADMGGGLAGDPLLEDCEISGNRSPYCGGGLWGTPVMRRCRVSGNLAYDGGGLYSDRPGALIEDSTFVGNTALEGARGGGLYIASGAIRRCLVAQNHGDGTGYSVHGAGINAAGPVSIERCTIADNRVVGADPLGSNVGGVFGRGTLVDCIVWGNDALQLDAIFGTSATYSDVGGGLPGAGNIDQDPLFADPANLDYHMQAGSPCIDAGDPAGALDPDWTRADMGAFPFPRANVLVRNGSGINSSCFASLTPPVVGGTWHCWVDPRAHSGALLSGFLGADAPLATGVSFPAGELLIDPSPAHRLIEAHQPSSGIADIFSIPIPADPTLVGLACYLQAWIAGGSLELCNGLDVKLGY